MNSTIWLSVAGGALVGGLASLIPRKRLGIALLCVVPIAMIVFAHIELADPARRPDALDALLYVFAPLWPSLGATIGFVAGRWVRRLVS